MSWNVSFSGNAIGVRAQFDAQIDDKRVNRMGDGEIADMETAKEVVASLANRHGVVSGSAGGNWFTTTTSGARFGQLNISVNRREEVEQKAVGADAPQTMKVATAVTD